MLEVADARADDVITAMKLTSATPTRSAAAVDAVRRGLRMAFWRARPAGRPHSATSGQPSVREKGLAARGLRDASPTNARTAPAPTMSPS